MDGLANILPENRGLFYGGAWHDPVAGNYYDNTNPANGADLGKVAIADAEDVDRAVAAAEEGFRVWRAVKPQERSAILRKIADRIREHGEELGLLDSIDGGFAIRYMSREPYSAANTVDYFAGLFTEMKGETVPMGDGVLNYMIREPYGVVARINAFNHPILFAVTKLAPPLMAGNSVILKPAEQDPLSVLRLAEIIGDMVPPGVFSVLTGLGETGAALTAHRRVPRVALIGSIESGQKVLRGAAEEIKHVTLELGGKNAFVVYPDANLDAVAAEAIDGMSFGRGCGQACSSNTRVFLHESIHDEVVAKLLERVSSLRIGDPTDPATDMGCVVSRRQHERILGYIESGKSEGARLIHGGGVPDDPDLGDGCFIEPTIFIDVDMSMRIAREEIFGPVMSVLKWSDAEEMLRQVNGTEYGLAASVWTSDLATAHNIAARLEAGYVWVNNTQKHFLGARFGGHKRSGLGVEECLEELLSYTQTKNINVTLEPKP